MRIAGASKQRENPVIVKITGFFIGAGNVTRTHDLLITKYHKRHRKKYAISTKNRNCLRLCRFCIAQQNAKAPVSAKKQRFFRGYNIP